MEWMTFGVSHQPIARKLWVCGVALLRKEGARMVMVKLQEGRMAYIFIPRLSKVWIVVSAVVTP